MVSPYESQALVFGHVFDDHFLSSTRKRGTDRSGRVHPDNVVNRSISRASKVLETLTRHGVSVSVIEPCRHELHVLETASPTSFRTKSMLAQPRVAIARLLKLDLGVALLIRHALDAKSALAAFECAYWASNSCASATTVSRRILACRHWTSHRR